VNKLGITVEYDVRRESAKIRTNVRPDKVEDLIMEFARTQIGAGKDTSVPEIRSVYTIKLVLDLSDDSWRVEHDCGNKGLREGILMTVARMITEAPTCVAWGQLT
jgi:hypothetical protein